MENPQIKVEGPSLAKQAEDQALGHVAALKELSKEFPGDKRTDEDKEYLEELLREGHGLRDNARETQPRSSVSVDQESVVITNRDKQHGVQEEVHVGGRVG